MFGENGKKIRDKIPIISEITGISVSTLLAYFLKSPGSAMAAGGFIQRILADYLGRVLSPIQEQRVITVSALAVDFIEKRLKERETLRNDGFFSEGTVTRSDAMEVVDSIVLPSEI